MKNLISLVLLSCFLSAFAAMPATNILSALTLEQAVGLAERQNPDLAEGKALIEAAEGRVQQAGRLPNPEVIARIEQAPFKGRTLDEAEYLAGIAQPVPLGSRLSKAKQVEQLERDRRAKELDVRRRDLRKRVHSAFATALYQERALLTQKEIAASADKVAATS